MAWWLFQSLVSTAVLAVVVAAVCRTTRIGPVGRHALWLVVLIKFVAPPLVVWPWAAPDPLRIAALDWRADRESTAGPSPPYAGDDPILPIDHAASTIDTVMPATPLSSLAAAADHALAPAWPWILGVWLAGSVGLLGIEGLRIIRLSRAARRAAPASIDLQARVARLSARLGVGPVDVSVVAGSAPPVVWGFVRPRLLWPASLPGASSDACLDGLLLHELAHIRRRDHLVGWVELAAGVAWWWNPLFWYVRSALREQAELACDAWVVSSLPDGRRAYAESLLALSGAAGPGVPSLAAVGVRATSRRVLERRLVMIMQGRAPLRLTWAGFVCLSVVAATTLPGWAAAGQSAPPPPPPVPVIVVPVEAPPPPVPATRQAPPPPRAVPIIVAPQAPPPPPRHVQPFNVQVASPTPQADSGEIAGQVTDQSDAPMPGVTVQVSGQDTERPMVAVTDPTGHYQFTIVPTDTYRMSFDLPGFKRVVRTGIIVETGFNAEVNAQLEPLAGSAPALPAAGGQLVDEFRTARAAIQQEADARIESQRQELVAALEALLDEYTKAGRLDEAVAIRDFLRAGLPGAGGGTVIGGRIFGDRQAPTPRLLSPRRVR